MQGVSKLSPEKQQLLKQRLQGAVRKQTATAPARVQHRSHHGWAPVTLSQRQIWFIDQMAPGNPAYNLPVAYRLRGRLDVGALEASFNEIIRRHEVLRTCFVLRNGEPIQQIQPDLTLHISIVNLEDVPESEREGSVQGLSTKEAIRSFDLTQLPLIRVSLFRLSELEHFLLINVHHIVSDGLSTSLLLNELDLIYSALTTGQVPHLPDLPVQYADLALRQAEDVSSKVYERQLHFWEGQFQNGAPILELPCDKPRPVVQSFAGSNVFFRIPKAFVHELETLGKGEGATFFMTILAAFQTLLHRYTGSGEFVVGTPVGDRSLPGTENLIGNLINVIPLMCHADDDRSFRQLLCATREMTLQALSNKDVPLIQIVEAVRFNRDPSRNPLFQAMLQVLPASSMGLGDLEISPLHFDLGFSQFDLSLHFYEDAGDYVGRFEYCSDLFNQSTIHRLSKNFEHLLRKVIESPDLKLSEISILTDAERVQLLGEWNNTAREYPREQCLHRLFELSAAKAPDAIAVVFGESTVTYRELDQRADQLAAQLRASGVGRDSIVPFCVERSLEMVVGVIGILKAGGAYLPLDPHLPMERLDFMVRDCGASLVVTQSSLKPLFSNQSARVFCLDVDPPMPNLSSSGQSNGTGDPESLAYVIYTSGSTGKPKGVQICHRSVVNLITSVAESLSLSSRDIALAVTTLSFDIATAELFLPLSVGARVVVVSSAVAADGQQLMAALQNSGATFLQPTPATWRLLLAAGWTGSPHLKMVSTGESLPVELAEQLLPKGRSLWNLYGPTETTIWSTGCQITQAEHPIQIGRPIANTQIYILDPHLQVVPIGVMGELYIGGDGLARGYLNRPELTAKHFIPNPFSAEPGARLYRTHDLARYRQDGSIECLGRVDHQVKIRGFRIELGEIEATLSNHPAIAQSVVRIWDQPTGEKQLAAYCVSKTSPPAAGELREHLRRSLPEYMIPGSFTILERLPLNSNGKVDRKLLPPPVTARSEADMAPTEAENLLEFKLIQIWERVLRRAPIRADDNFFDLGGNSLLATRLAADIEKLLGHRFPIATLFQAPSVAALARALSQEDWMPRWGSLVPLQPRGYKLPLFFVHGWGGNVYGFVDLARELSPDQPAYGLQALQTKDGKPRHTSVEEMASHYISEMRALQPKGPYFLCGYSAGGWIAYEIARRLIEAGEPVGLLALLDTHPVSVPFKVVFSYSMQRIGFHLKQLAARNGRGRLEYLARLRGIVPFVFKATKKPVVTRVEPGPARRSNLPNEDDHYYRAVKAYAAPGNYPGPIDLFVSENAHRHKLCYWNYLIDGGVRFHPVSGAHLEMLDPAHLGGFAHCFNDVLRSAQLNAVVIG